MITKNSIVAIYPAHTAAESAVKELQESGFDMKKLSIVIGGLSAIGSGLTYPRYIVITPWPFT